jgi:hypothetical protein
VVYVKIYILPHQFSNLLHPFDSITNLTQTMCGIAPTQILSSARSPQQILFPILLRFSLLKTLPYLKSTSTKSTGGNCLRTIDFGTMLCPVKFEVFTAGTMKNCVFWDVTPCGSCENRRFGGTCRFRNQGDKIGELGATLAATSNRRTLRRNTDGSDRFLRNIGSCKSHTVSHPRRRRSS